MVIRDDAHSRGLVLVVEDNEGMRQAIDKLLDAAGFSGIAYSSAEDLIAGGRLDDALCVISDIKLPATSGFELLTQMRARGTCAPVILISANDNAAIRNKAKSSGAAAYLAKPFPGNELLAAIEHIVESARSKRIRVHK
jgi:FixJ family two-component response regulator